jgi:ornithine decarboxylase
MAYLAGAHPDKIICANPALSPSDIESLLRSGLRYFVADAGPHVHALAYNAKKCGIDPGELHVLIRLDFSDPAAHFQLASKFGATIDDGLLLGALITDLGLHLAGAHFHLGSQSESSNAATSAALAATKFVTTLSVANPIIDVGGGFPAPYKDAPPWRHFAQALSEGLSPATRVFCEPGRLLASAGTTLVASVISVASRQDKNFVHVDAGAYHGLLEFSGLVHGSPLETTVHVVTAFPERTVPTHLVGPTCDALDTIFAGCVDLPQLAVGDLVLFDLAGAYSTACSSPFNGFSVPTVIEL